MAALPFAPADVLVPDGGDLEVALSRTTDLGIGAHPDDLELAMLVPIAHARERSDRWFTGVIATDGAGSARSGSFADVTDEEMVEIRRREQRTAATIGAYSAMVQLGHPSAFVRGDGFAALVEELAALVRATRPDNVYTHNLLDKHVTHVAVGLATIAAIRQLPVDERPYRVAGVEGWRDLDWLPDHDKVAMDASPHGALAEQLAACFPSQIDGGKRYDLAAEGRRRANATLREPRQADDATEIIVAMDLSPLIKNDEVNPLDYALAAIDRFRSEAAGTLRSIWPG